MTQRLWAGHYAAGPSPNRWTSSGLSFLIYKVRLILPSWEAGSINREEACSSKGLIKDRCLANAGSLS